MLSVLLWTAFIVGESVSSVAIQHDTAVLRWLDKVSARVVTLEAPVGQTLYITGSTLRVLVHACVTRPRTETQEENAAFLEIWEIKPAEPAVDVFRGWMFSSNPAFSAMEHPIYDGWLLTCQNNAEVNLRPSAIPADTP